jgi:dTDP-4-dehydrorhamnose reductase
MNKKILLTGANGLLGQKLVDLIPAQGGFDLIATGRGENRNPISESTPYEYIKLDITNRDEVLEVIGKTKPDYIIHTAAMTNVDQCEEDKEGCWKNNVDAVQYLVEAAEKNNSFLLHLSTDFIFDGANGPYLEEANPNPISYYGESKLAAEKIVLEATCQWAIARTVLVYGLAHDMSRSNIILWVKQSLENGKSIQVVNDQWRTPTLAEDLAMGCFLIVKHTKTGVFNISGSDLLNPFQMATMTANYFNLDKNLIQETDGSKFQQKAKRPPKTGFIIKKAENLLGYKPRTFEQGIKVLAEQLAQVKNII